MKYYLTLVVLLIFIGCKDQSKKSTTTENTTPTEEVGDPSPYPTELNKVFEAHGGLEQWRSMKSLVYEIPKEGFNSRVGI